jgi:MFS family permease
VNEPAAHRFGFGALTHRNFQLFLGGQLVSLTGTWMQSVAQGWLVLTLTNSAFYVGLVSALGSVPVLLFSLYGGVVADRTDKRRLVVLTQVLLMLQAVVLTVLVTTGTVRVGHVMVLAVALGTVSAFDIPGRQSFLVEMVGKDDLMSAIALNSSVFNLTRVLGPALAGIVIGTAGLAACFALNAASYLAVIVGLALMRLPRYQPPPVVESAWANLKAGIRYVRGDRRVSALIVLTAVISVFGFPYLVMLPVFARDVLHTDAGGYGALMSAVGAGAVVAALALAVWRTRLRRGRLVLTALAGFGILLVGVSAARSLAVALALLVFTGCVMILHNASTNTMLQTLVPDAMRGRIMGFYAFVFVGMAPVGAFVAGAIAERWGAPFAVALGGVGCLVAAAVAWVRVKELRETT